MNTPLSVHALYHSQNKEGARIYSELYTLLCRDVGKPFTDGLDIPVYFVTGDNNTISPIVKSSSIKKVLLLFIDIHMFCSENWRKKIHQIMEESDENMIVVGVKQYKHAFSFNKALGDIQGITFDESEKEELSLFEGNNWDKFTTQLFDLLIRIVTDKPNEPLRIFISHSKHDSDKEGLDAAKQIKEFLASDTKLNSFFDVHDILDGYCFKEQIQEAVATSALFILFSDTYSSREWCRIEALTAKENHIPMAAVSLIKHHINRVFPYIGNIPLITYEGDWRRPINLLLRTILDQKFELAMFQSEADENTVCIPYPPEAYNMSLLQEKTTTVLYPEPPLGNEEMEVLHKISRRMDRTIQFVTPMSHNTKEINLQQQYIGISISDSPDLPAIGIGEEMLKDLQIELTRHILKANGRIVYGGDLRKGGFTEIFKELAKQYGQQEQSDPDVCYIKNYLSWPIYNRLTINQKADYLSSRIELVNATPGKAVEDSEKSSYVQPRSLEDKLKWATSLEAMRQEIVQATSARIIVGGRMHGFAGFMAGLAEEFKVAIQHNQPVFLMGGFGGASRLLCDIIEGRQASHQLLEKASTVSEYKDFYQWCEENGNHIDYEFFDHIKIEDLRNGLTQEENLRLFSSVDIIEIVSLVLKGINKRL